MSVTRREFIERTVSAGAFVAVSSSLNAVFPGGIESVSLLNQDLTGERVAYTPATWYRPYRSKIAQDPGGSTWVQIDLGFVRPIDEVKLLPALEVDGFPVRFRLEVSDDPQLTSSSLIADRSLEDYPNLALQVVRFKAGGVSGRYVRLTVSRLRGLWKPGTYRFSLYKLEVIYDGSDIAERCPVSADEVLGNLADCEQLTRSPRPMGEFVVTDHPENVTAASSWMRVPYNLNAPRGGVALHGGVFQTAMENNVRYLLESYSVDDLLSEFRMRAGKPNPSQMKDSTSFWINLLAGSNAGRFLMGAGNTLRWMNHPELRARLNAVVDGIEECKQPNGYIMAYPEETILESDRGGYTRSWVTHGLIEAGYAGNTKAFQLLRGFYDWFDKCSYLPELMRRGGQGAQGMIANTRTYLTPVGRPEDIQVIQRHYQEDYWLEGLSAGEESMVWQYPYDRPHCYLLADFEAYLDLYCATGDSRYRDAVLGGWKLFHDKWLHLGGSTAIIEDEEDPPLSYRLHGLPPHNGWDPVQTGELCGSVFWTFLNQRLYFLDPEREAYVTEIEKSIYNVGLANQVGSSGIIYHAKLLGTKEECTRHNTCCEGQGTRLYGSLPEHIYSIAEDGISVNLFEPSTIQWKQAGRDLSCTMRTKFPFDSKVELVISTVAPTRSKIRMRIPSWTSGTVPVAVNGKVERNGVPGSFLALDRVWRDGDRISVAFPMQLKMTEYQGVDQIPGKRRYGFEYGPILLAAVGADDVVLQVASGERHKELLKQIRPDPEQPLHFIIDRNLHTELMPYWLVANQPFTCFPAVETESNVVPERTWDCSSC